MKAARLEDGVAPHPRRPDPRTRVRGGADPHQRRRRRATPTSTSPSGDWYGIGGSGVLGHEAIGIVEALGPGADAYVSVGDRVILGLGGAGRRVLVRRVPVLPQRPARACCAQSKPIMGTFAEYFTVWAQVAGRAPRRARRRRGAARVRRPHRVRRGEEAARRTTCCPAARSRSSAPPAGSGTTRCRSPRRSATRSSASTSARTGSTSCKSLGADYAVERRRGARAPCRRELGGVDASLVFSARDRRVPARLRPARAARPLRGRRPPADRATATSSSTRSSCS